MIPGVIFAFLIGSVLAWGFRVWILVPVTLLAIIISLILELSIGATFATAAGHAIVTGLAPQFGYAFGLLARNTILASRLPLVPRSSRSASVAMLYKQRSVDRTR